MQKLGHIVVFFILTVLLVKCIYSKSLALLLAISYAALTEVLQLFFTRDGRIFDIGFDGIVGAAGAFLLVPIMLVVLKIPTRMTIASSLAITFLSSIGATVGKITTGQVQFLPSIIMIIASLIASPLGAMAGKKINTKILQVVLALLILATAIKIWMDIL